MVSLTRYTLIAAIVITLGLIQSSNAAETAQVCCSSRADCPRMISELSSLAETDARFVSVNTALENFVKQKLRFNNQDLAPLSLDQKDSAGTYQLNPAAMLVRNEWKTGDAPGISSDV